MRSSRFTLGGHAGFTLLETMIAMAIMLVAFASILMVESGSIMASAKAKRLNVVAMLANNAMVDAEYAIEGKTFDEVEKEKSGTFPSPYEDYTWTRTVKELKFPSLAIGAGGSGGASGGGGSGDGSGAVDQATDLVAKLMTNFLSKAMRQLDVTVSWKDGTATQSFTVSTYWVDLNHEFQLSE